MAVNFALDMRVNAGAANPLLASAHREEIHEEDRIGGWYRLPGAVGLGLWGLVRRNNGKFRERSERGTGCIRRACIVGPGGRRHHIRLG